MDAKVHRYLRRLRADFPLRMPVRVRMHNSITDHNGHRIFASANLIAEQFQIDIAEHADPAVLCESLMHEWAHCLLWPQCRYRHSKRFWLTYGKIYSHYLDE
jgi:hypothetical protein